jgi:hypothetical protein
MPDDAPKENWSPVDQLRVRFAIIHLLYATALLASGLATFGTGGLCPATMVLIGWAYVFASKSRPKALLHVGIFVLIGFCLCGLFLPAVSPAREASRRMQCANNMKQIALALHNYHAAFKTLPPAYIPDENGKAKHSWRVLILPFVEEQALYDAYDFNEPWDGPNNRQLADQMPSVYACPSHYPRRGAETSYLAVVGGRTIWPHEHGLVLRHIIDGTANTLFFLEATSQEIHWMEPRDIDYESALELLTSNDTTLIETGHRRRDFFYDRYVGRNIAIADGSVRFLPAALSDKAASELLIRNDRTPLVAFDFEVSPEFRPVHRLRLGNCLRLGGFVLIALFPLPWVWRRPRA